MNVSSRKIHRASIRNLTFRFPKQNERERGEERGAARKSQRPALDAFKAFPNVSRDDL